MVNDNYKSHRALLVSLFLLSFSFIQIIDKNFYHNSKFNFYSNSIINTINDLKQNFSEYFELKIINENLIIEILASVFFKFAS